jgi:hypothetical protein
MDAGWVTRYKNTQMTRSKPTIISMKLRVSLVRANEANEYVATLPAVAAKINVNRINQKRKSERVRMDQAYPDKAA